MARRSTSSSRLQPLGRQQQPLTPRPQDRIGVPPAMLLELALVLPHPALPSLRARHNPRRVELQRHHLLGRLGLSLRLLVQLLGVGVIVAQPLSGLTKELASAFRRAQLLGQLITARLAV